jgi:low affinity Fe/Cu permease
VKLDEIITHLEGPRDELAGVESKSHEEIEELRVEGVSEPPTSSGLLEEPAPS